MLGDLQKRRYYLPACFILVTALISGCFATPQSTPYGQYAGQRQPDPEDRAERERLAREVADLRAGEAERARKQAEEVAAKERAERDRLAQELAAIKTKEEAAARNAHTHGGPVKGRWALVVGVSNYQRADKAGLEDLAYAADDARAFAALLKKQGWSDDHIRLLVNEQATQRGILVALESWLTKAGPDDMVVLFWSGHGFPDPEDPEKVYFACHDTDIRIPATGYRMDRVIQSLAERDTRNVVVLADTCHAGKLITRGDEKAIAVRPYVAKLDREKSVPKGWIFMVASDTDRKAIEHSSWKNGAFTHCLLNALSGAADGYQGVGAKDGTVTMLELRTYLESRMPNETQKVLGVAKRPIITTSSGDQNIWNLTLKAK